MTDRPKPSFSPPDRSTSGLVSRIDELRTALKPAQPEKLAEQSGATCLLVGPGRGEIRLSLFDSPLVVTFPNLIAVTNTGDIQPDHIQALLLYYFITADGASLEGRWVSFADLPGGRMYAQAYQGYTGNELVRAFGENIATFNDACRKAGGQPAEVGSSAFTFQALPRVPLLVTYWLGDEDFPSTCKILFDASATHYLPIDVCAILGSTLTRRLLRNLR